MDIRRFFEILRAPNDGGGGDAPAIPAAPATPAPSPLAAAARSAAGGDGVAPAAPGTETPPAEAPKAWAKPDWLPDHLAGTSPDEALEKTFKAFDGFRQKAAARGEVPKDVAGYTYTPPDDLKPYFAENDPGLKILAEAAHGLGLSKGEYEALASGFVGKAVASGLVPKPFDAMAELGKIGKGLNLPDTKEGKAELARIVGDMGAFADNLGVQLGLPDGPRAMLSAMADTADGLLALHAIRGRLGARGPQIDGAQSTGATKEDLKAMAADPRIDPNSPSYDKRVREQYDADFRRLFG